MSTHGGLYFFFIVVVVVCRFVFWSCLGLLFSAEEKTSFLFTGRSFAEDGSIIIRRSATTNDTLFFVASYDELPCSSQLVA